MRTIAYLSYPHFADCDLPLLHYLQQREPGLIYILQLTQKDKCRTLIHVEQLKDKGGVYPATDYPGLGHLSSYLDLTRVYVLNMPGLHDFSFQNLHAVGKLKSFLRKRQCSLIHFTWPLRYGAFPLYALHKKMLLTVHDPLPHSSEQDFMNRLHRKVAFRLVPHFMLLNQAQRAAFIEQNKLQETCVFDSRLSIYLHLKDTTPVLPHSSGYVLFFGGINSHKGVDVLCEAMQQVHRSLPQLSLVIAGSGRLYFDITPYTSAGFVVLHNRYLSDEELKGFILQSLFVVCPYIDATQSGVIMSAFALAKPVIATSVGALPEMVEDRRHGLIVPPRDSGSLAHAIIRLAEDQMLREQMQQHILHDFHSGCRSWEHIANGICNIYNQLTNASK
ncbi:MAG: glycosyltransferase family 4 protein [Prevotella sp.]|nr:glycosyltransferase family 4 protein [Prevotella sp.]